MGKRNCLTVGGGTVAGYEVLQEEEQKAGGCLFPGGGGEGGQDPAGLVTTATHSRILIACGTLLMGWCIRYLLLVWASIYGGEISYLLGDVPPVIYCL